MQIRELALTELLSAYDIVKQLYPQMSYDEFEDLIYDMRDMNYKMIGIFEDNEIVAYAGVAICTTLLYKRHLRVFEFIADTTYKPTLQEYLKDYAKIGMCEEVIYKE
ncbi:hypothetical protein MNB_SM-3-211 [hydrothermal vent metagenome]|uniref:N-acetyltransferase domain-containing protein n=1 Tax=hydrothermal vent metagenome TaxID=652676 RepID=A0A1W1D307_9ZZZZ